jgi:hypothetical protein
MNGSGGRNAGATNGELSEAPDSGAKSPLGEPKAASSSLEDATRREDPPGAHGGPPPAQTEQSAAPLTADEGVNQGADEMLKEGETDARGE